MKQISDTKILRGKPSQEVTDIITCFAKFKHLPRILIVTVLMTNGETTKAVNELLIVMHHIRPSDTPKRRILYAVLQSGKILLNDMVLFLFNTVIYVFLLLCLCIFIVMSMYSYCMFMYGYPD